jgi:hypothetical protein
MDDIYKLGLTNLFIEIGLLVQDLCKDTNCGVNIGNNYQKYTTYRSNT